MIMAAVAPAKPRDEHAPIGREIEVFLEALDVLGCDILAKPA
jgi:hypothetical protein